MNKDYRTVDQKVRDLYVKLAGEKLDQVEASVFAFVTQGKSYARAMADSLEKHKCLKNPKAEDLPSG